MLLFSMGWKLILWLRRLKEKEITSLGSCAISVFFNPICPQDAPSLASLLLSYTAANLFQNDTTHIWHPWGRKAHTRQQHSPIQYNNISTTSLWKRSTFGSCDTKCSLMQAAIVYIPKSLSLHSVKKPRLARVWLHFLVKSMHPIQLPRTLRHLKRVLEVLWQWKMLKKC